MSGCNCSSCGCAHEKGEMMYLYRNKKGVNMFTGFIQKNNDIIWIGKMKNQCDRFELKKIVSSF